MTIPEMTKEHIRLTEGVNESQQGIMSHASIIANAIAKAEFYRLQAKAQKVARKMTRICSSRTEEIKQLHLQGLKSNQIAKKLGLVKEDVDAIITINKSTLAAHF